MFVSSRQTGSMTIVTPLPRATSAIWWQNSSNCAQAVAIGQPSGTRREAALPQLMTSTPISAARPMTASR